MANRTYSIAMNAETDIIVKYLSFLIGRKKDKGKTKSNNPEY